MAVKPSPIIPSNTEDRTGTAGILRRYNAEIRRRFAGLKRDILALFRGIRILTANEDVRVFYQMTPEQLSRLSVELQAALERWIANGRDPADIFWASQYAVEATQLGAAQSVANLTRLSDVYAATRTLQEVVYSEPYRTRLAAAQLRSQDHWTGLSGQLRGELSSIIGRAVVDGKNPRAVEKEIAERLGVSMSRAQQYAQTEITGALRDARAAEADFAEEQMDIKLALLWTSALKATTRPWHASRNGKAYSTAEVRAFYSVSGNKYNCRCSQVEVLLDENGKPIISKQAQQTFAAQRAGWLRKYGGE